jgi:FkbM family methyltransferase
MKKKSPQPFISFAQNYEDVILWRALKHVKNGFYIDVGANDPVVDSITKAFYDRGWRGINVEPLKSHYQDLLKARPNDINLLCAAGSKRGQIDIWECNVRGWATASSDVIQKHEQEGYTGVLHKVPLFPLEDICEQYVQGDIHFLKIDVEGFEKDVLKGINFKRFRPWIVVIEATKPNSTEEIYENYEALIVSNNYTFAYADGLNRFYISKEQAPYLLHRLRYPPNVFDGYIRVQQYDSEIKAEQAQQQTVEAKAKAEQAQQQTVEAKDKA